MPLTFPYSPEAGGLITALILDSSNKQENWTVKAWPHGSLSILIEQSFPRNCGRGGENLLLYGTMRSPGFQEQASEPLDRPQSGDMQQGQGAFYFR